MLRFVQLSFICGQCCAWILILWACHKPGYLKSIKSKVPPIFTCLSPTVKNVNCEIRRLAKEKLWHFSLIILVSILYNTYACLFR